MDDVITSKHGKKIEVRKDIVKKSEKVMRKGQVKQPYTPHVNSY